MTKNEQGFTLIELMIVIAIIAIIAAIAIPNLLEARKTANESAAVSTLRTLVTTQSLFRDADKDGDGNADFAPSGGTAATSFTALIAAANGSLLDETLADGIKQGYTFVMNVPADGFSWSCTAIPQSDKTGTRRFFVNETGVIRFTVTGTPVAGNQPVGN